MAKNPKLAFLIPIASPRVIKDWRQACKYLHQTIRSILNSSSDNYCVVVAGHEPPDFALPQDSRFKFLSCDHPLPSGDQGYWIAAIQDKMANLSAAWTYAKATWNPDYVMKVDWDDLISSRLVLWLEWTKGEAGFRIVNGWIWGSESRCFIQTSETFDLVCGTCLIIRSDVADLAGPFLNTLEGAQFNEESLRIEATNNRSLIPGALTGTLLLNENHGRAGAQFQYLGHELGTIPFHGAVYRVRNSQSVSQRGFKMHTLRFILGAVRRTRLITPGLKQEFILE